MATVSVLFGSILQALNQAKVVYKLIEHEPVFTMEQAAEVCKHRPEQGVKVLLVKLYTAKHQSTYWLVVWQGNEEIPFEEICTKTNHKKWKLASPQEVKEELGIEIGALAPFGYAKTYPTIFDSRLLEQEQVFINAGVHDKTIALAPKDLKDLLTMKIQYTHTQYISHTNFLQI